MAPSLGSQLEPLAADPLTLQGTRTEPGLTVSPSPWVISQEYREACVIVPKVLPAPPGLSSYLCLHGTAKLLTNHLSWYQPRSSAPTTLASLTKHRLGWQEAG